MKIRVTVLASKNSTEYLVDKVIETDDTPKVIVKQYQKQYPAVHCIEAQEVSIYRTNRYSESTCLY